MKKQSATFNKLKIASVKILRRDDRMCWQWIWDVGQVRIPRYWHHTSRKWWVSTSASVNWQRLELYQGTLTSHTGRTVWVALYVLSLFFENKAWPWNDDAFRVTSVTSLLHLQKGNSRGPSFSRWLCRLADSSISGPLVWSVKVPDWGQSGFKTPGLHGSPGLQWH